MFFILYSYIIYFIHHLTNLDHVNRHASADQDRATLIAQLINKHQEQKEAFLKVILIIITILIITITNII